VEDYFGIIRFPTLKNFILYWSRKHVGVQVLILMEYINTIVPHNTIFNKSQNTKK